jgi:hypothetical protein
MSPAAFRIWSSGHRCAYVFKVVVAVACLSARWTVTTLHPSAISPLAKNRLRS